VGGENIQPLHSLDAKQKMRVWAEIMDLNNDWISNNDGVPAQKRDIAAGSQTVQIVNNNNNNNNNT